MDLLRRIRKRITRRDLLRQGLQFGALAPFAGSALLRAPWLQRGPKPQPAPPPVTSPFYQVDEALLEEIENANFRYFWEQANPESGIVRDRCNAINPDKSDLGSIASTGFGLTALCIGDHSGYV